MRFFLLMAIAVSGCSGSLTAPPSAFEPDSREATVTVSPRARRPIAPPVLPTVIFKGGGG